MPLRPRSVYIVKGIDPDTWQRFKARCHAEGHTVKWVILQLIRAYTTTAPADDPKPDTREESHR